jgi:hypothetical protein
MEYLMTEAEQDDRLELRRRIDAWRRDPARADHVRFLDLFLEGYGHGEIAERMGTTPASCRTRLWQIRRELADEVRRDRAAAEEVRGRTAAAPALMDMSDTAAHLDVDSLQGFADGLLEPEQDATAAAHCASCVPCAEEVFAARFGLALLSILSPAPAVLAGRVRAPDTGPASG